MSLVKNLIQDPTGPSRIAVAGDIICTNEVVPAANTSTALTFTGAMLSSPIFLSNPGGAATYTLDTAANILAALAPQFIYNANASNTAGTAVFQGIEPGTAWRIKIVNASANAITVAATANTGIVVNRGSVAASVSRDFLVTVKAGAQAQSYAPTSTSGSAVLYVTPAQAATLVPGMIVTNAVLNLQGQTIISVNTTSGAVTMSGNANATGSSVFVNFSPVVQIDGL
jgi:hypothetical protein